MIERGLSARIIEITPYREDDIRDIIKRRQGNAERHGLTISDVETM